MSLSQRLSSTRLLALSFSSVLFMLLSLHLDLLIETKAGERLLLDEDQLDLWITVWRAWVSCNAGQKADS